ncbi:hypothetical protein PVAP13_8KG330401 [Panicum virgatum]|uniref:Uncharacterized protein n=1 Tax=Panicum virgatum TaxID=38727 RepID=A0A8T0PW30_PANVG|nr:hypothetical protein PVAP13_8KG330401 [Panicum virgatum]
MNVTFVARAMYSPPAHGPHLTTPGAASPGDSRASEAARPPPLHPASTPLHLCIPRCRPSTSAYRSGRPSFSLSPTSSSVAPPPHCSPLAATLSHPLGDPDLPARPQFGSLYLVILLSAYLGHHSILQEPLVVHLFVGCSWPS